MVRIEQKAVATCAELIQRYSFAGAYVADMFCGTGSSALACLLLGRRFIGTDIDVEVVGVAKNRCVTLMKDSTMYHKLYRKQANNMKDWRGEFMLNADANPEKKYSRIGVDEGQTDLSIAQVWHACAGYVVKFY